MASRPQVLDYGHADPPLARAWAWLPRLTGGTWRWLLAAILACWLAYLRGGAWQVERQIEGWPIDWATAVSPDGGRAILRSPRPTPPPAATQPAAPASHRDLYIWELASGQRLRTLERAGEAAAAAWTPDARRVLTHQPEAAVTIWNPDTGKPISTFDSGARERGYILSPGGSVFIMPDRDGMPELRDALNGRLIRRLNGIFGPRFSTDGSKILFSKRLH